MNSILFFDSGVGGLPSLEHLRERRADFRYYFLTDTVFFPYGEKSREAIRDRLRIILPSYIKELSPSLLVLACNSASVSALDMLREMFSIPVIGTFPP